MNLCATTKFKRDKVEFCKNVLPLVKTLDFVYNPNYFQIDPFQANTQRYSKIGDKYYYTKFSHHSVYSRNENEGIVEYRLKICDFPLDCAGYNKGRYLDCMEETCWVTLEPLDKIKHNCRDRQSFQIETYFFTYYTRIPHRKNLCICCPRMFKNRHNFSSITHLSNMDKFIIELSKNSKINLDCLKNIFSFL